MRSKGAEIGLRSQPSGFSTLAAFVLDFDSEIVFLGDAGTTEASRPSQRIGVELTSNYRPTAVGERSISTSPTPGRASPTIRLGGDQIPGAPAFVASGGVTLGGDTGWFGALRLRSLGPRPLISDGSVYSSFTTTLNARAGLRLRHRASSSTSTPSTS